jgi:putative membrane protein
MGWGILFRREINLTYSRIQDIHLVSNIVERWLGLARIQIQTASGSAKAEMTLSGLLQFERVRDFLYSRMRGARDAGFTSPPVIATTASVSASADGVQDLAAVLGEVAAELRAVRVALESRRGPNE